MKTIPKKKLKAKVLVVMPAYNAERTLKDVYEKIDNKLIDHVLLVDDGSSDNTVSLSKKLGIKTIVHKKNKGYGGNQKTCYTYALKIGADYIIMLHPDGQYDPKDLPKFVDTLKSGKADLILGSRFMGKKDETPFYKSFSIKTITFLFNLVLGTRISEANTGYRGYTRKALNTIPFMKNGDGYIFDPQAIIQVVNAGLKIKDVPVSKIYNKEAISPNLSKSIEHGLENIKLLWQYLLHKHGIKNADFLA